MTTEEDLPESFKEAREQMKEDYRKTHQTEQVEDK